MNHQVFVPVTDDMIYNHPEKIEGPLVPYEAGMECHEWLSIELNPEDDEVIESIVKRKAKGKRRHANLSLVYGAAMRT